MVPRCCLKCHALCIVLTASQVLAFQTGLFAVWQSVSNSFWRDWGRSWLEGGERGRNVKDQGEERGVEDQYMGGLFWHKIGLWSKRLDQLSVTWSMFYSSQFWVPSRVAGTWQELSEGVLTEGGGMGLWRIGPLTAFRKVSAYADIKLKELIAFG